MKYQEQRMWIAQTEAWINADPVDLVLNRPTSDAVRNDNAGGRLPLETSGDFTSLAPQRVRIIPARSRSTSLTYTTDVGEVIEARDKLLIGMPTLDIKRNDWLVWQNKAFMVAFVDTDRTYQTKAQLEMLGEGPRETV